MIYSKEIEEYILEVMNQYKIVMSPIEKHNPMANDIYGCVEVAPETIVCIYGVVRMGGDYAIGLTVMKAGELCEEQSRLIEPFTLAGELDNID